MWTIIMQHASLLDLLRRRCRASYRRGSWTDRPEATSDPGFLSAEPCALARGHPVSTVHHVNLESQLFRPYRPEIGCGSEM